MRSLHAGGNSEVTIAIAADIDGETWTYRLVLQAGGTPQKPGPARVVQERVEHDGKKILSRPDEHDDRDPELLLATALEQRSANAKFRVLRDFLRAAEYIHVVPQLVRMPSPADARRFGKGLGTGLIGAMGEVPKKTRSVPAGGPRDPLRHGSRLQAGGRGSRSRLLVERRRLRETASAPRLRSVPRPQDHVVWPAQSRRTP